MSTQPLVGVVISNYNYARFLRTCIDTVLSQTYRNIEILVVDDGSTDDSRTVLESYGRKVRAIFQANGGQAAALGAGLSVTNGDIICLLDADDGWFPNKVERVVQELERHRTCDWLGHPLEVVDAEKRPAGALVSWMSRTGIVRAHAASIAERVVTVSTSALALRRSALSLALPLPQSSAFRFDADALLLARIATRSTGYRIQEALGWYRRHEHQQFGANDDESMRRMLERQVAVGSLIARELGRAEPVVNFKHRAVLAALSGKSSAPHVLRGLAAGMRLAPRPGLMLRQCMSLCYAGMAPRHWTRALKQKQGFDSSA